MVVWLVGAWALHRGCCFALPLGTRDLADTCICTCTCTVADLVDRASVTPEVSGHFPSTSLAFSTICWVDRRTVRTGARRALHRTRQVLTRVQPLFCEVVGRLAQQIKHGVWQHKATNMVHTTQQRKHA